MESLNKVLARTFSDIADAIETGSFGQKPRIVVTGMDSEHGEATIIKAAAAAAARGIEVLYIGTLTAKGVTTIPAATAEEGRGMIDELLDSGRADAAVTMHYPFPIGVSTVGRAVTPARGREIFIATTTGTASADRVEGMIKNIVYGAVAAKACGVEKPTVGILNVEGAVQAEAALRKLCENGYGIDMAASARAEGGAILRGNDVLLGTADVLVCDPLTGNILMKMLSASASGGDYEVTGYGYGPGIGEGYGRQVLIVSRASGAPVIENAIVYAAQLVRGNLSAVAAAEFEAADRAGLKDILSARREWAARNAGAVEEVAIPKAEPVTASIAGIEVMDIEDAAKTLWKQGIYAETGMGCTGPLVMISEDNCEKAKALLREAGYID